MSKTNKVRTLSFRLAEDDYQKLVERCRKAELSKSVYLRYLIRIPIVCDEATEESAPCVVLDKRSIRDISRELTRWGYHYNQAVHALNAIAYYLRANDMDTLDVLEELDLASGKLAAMQPGIEELRREAEAISERAIAGIGR